ncbi:MAG: polyphosphate kinase 1, partial [Bacteroidia bacterium]
SPQLENEPLPPLTYEPFEGQLDLFPIINQRDHLLHFPYHSYDYFIRFLNRAAIDPTVSKIMTTQYRVASESAIVGALIRAAGNGKDVTVFVEIKARFDEERNLQSAKAMEDAGVRIIYSLPGLKVHAKVALVLRQETDGERGYAFLSTGNFNEKTARIYADHGLFTADQTIIGDLKQMFGFLKDTSNKNFSFDTLLVAQFNLRDRFLEMIDREIAHSKAGKKGRMVVKLNGLEDRPMINKLYDASQAGVEIDLIVRGICCLRPGVPGLSENIRVIRIIDRFLEHARVFYFHNDGEEDLYLASADWMTRNLERRVETGFPIKEPSLKKQIIDILNLQLTDNVKAVELSPDIENVPAESEGPPVRAQIATYEYVRAL